MAEGLGKLAEEIGEQADLIRVRGAGSGATGETNFEPAGMIRQRQLGHEESG